MVDAGKQSDKLAMDMVNGKANVVDVVTAVSNTEIMVEGFQAKDGSTRANGRAITFPDGKKRFVGSSGTGAPRDGRDGTEK